MSNNEYIKQALSEMVDELNDAELLDLTDFITNECSNEAFMDNEGNYPNLFRMFVTSVSNRPY
jgi:hypothetical protein